jgi:hypothetical protein
MSLFGDVLDQYSEVHWSPMKAQLGAKFKTDQYLQTVLPAVTITPKSRFSLTHPFSPIDAQSRCICTTALLLSADGRTAWGKE